MRPMADDEIILRVATILGSLGPFATGTPRESKWRTTEQLANALWQSHAHVHITHLDELLTRYEAEYRNRLENGIQPDALIRRAVYPDRTAALPLWGATIHHGQPWLNQPAVHRTDPPDDIPDSRRVPESAPSVFLSHASLDEKLAAIVAEALAAMQIGAWMFETNVGYGQNIASCVRDAMKECSCCIALVTRESIASLWVLTELHNALNVGRPCFLILDAADSLLVCLLSSLAFHYPCGMFDTSVDYDKTAISELEIAYAKRQGSESRVQRYGLQVHDFLATLPLYLDHLQQPAFAFPHVPQGWSGPLVLNDFGSLRDFIYRVAQ
jgi:hypothetical protein